MLKWQVFKMDSHYQKFMSGNSEQFGLTLPKDFSYQHIYYSSTIPNALSNYCTNSFD